MSPLVWTRRAIEDVRSIERFIAHDSPHYAQLVAKQLLVAVEGLPVFPQSGRVVPELNNPAIREVIQGSYRLIQGEIHILTVHHAARMFKLEP